MAHDHGEKIHFCKECGYWEVANGRFSITNCKGCGKVLSSYASRLWLIDNVDSKFASIPKNKTHIYGLFGFADEKIYRKNKINKILKNIV